MYNRGVLARGLMWPDPALVPHTRQKIHHQCGRGSISKGEELAPPLAPRLARTRRRSGEQGGHARLGETKTSAARFLARRCRMLTAYRILSRDGRRTAADTPSLLWFPRRNSWAALRAPRDVGSAPEYRTPTTGGNTSPTKKCSTICAALSHGRTAQRAIRPQPHARAPADQDHQVTHRAVSARR